MITDEQADRAIADLSTYFKLPTRGHIRIEGESQEEVDRNNQQREMLEQWRESYPEQQRRIHDYTRPCADPACAEGCTENDHWDNYDIYNTEAGCRKHAGCGGYREE